MKPLKRKYKWRPIAKRFRSKTGHVVKVYDEKVHKCHRCKDKIEANEEYYLLRNYGKSGKFPICEMCWSGNEAKMYDPKHSTAVVRSKPLEAWKRYRAKEYDAFMKVLDRFPLKSEIRHRKRLRAFKVKRGLIDVR